MKGILLVVGALVLSMLLVRTCSAADPIQVYPPPQGRPVTDIDGKTLTIEDSPQVDPTILAIDQAQQKQYHPQQTSYRQTSYASGGRFQVRGRVRGFFGARAMGGGRLRGLLGCGG